MKVIAFERSRGMAAFRGRLLRVTMAVMSTPLQKGDQLENAVKAIEETILRDSPAFAENSFRIESKKLLISQGVKHEIDLFVSVNISIGYEAIFIFECKNWEDKVNKNEIIVFSEKISVANAQRGFFVRKSFTKDAIAQAAKDPRTQLLVAADFSNGNVQVPFDFHILILDGSHIELAFDARIKENPERPNRARVSEIVLDGESVSLQVVASKLSDRIWDERSKTFRSDKEPEGIHSLMAEGIITFEPGRLFANGREIAAVKYKCEFKARVARPPVVSYFSVENRGRSMQLAPVLFDTGRAGATNSRRPYY